jgi:hypothetical protein
VEGVEEEAEDVREADAEDAEAAVEAATAAARVAQILNGPNLSRNGLPSSWRQALMALIAMTAETNQGLVLTDLYAAMN